MRGSGVGGRPLRTRLGVGLVAATLVAGCGPGGGPADDALGMRVGGGFFDGGRFEAAEDWLGVEIAYTVQFTGRQTQRDMNGSAFGLLASDEADLPGFAERVDLSLTVPLGFGRANARSLEGREEIRANLESVAAGDYDDAYRRIADRLVESGFEDAVLRLGHEFNGAWAPWSSRTNEDAFVAAWRHVHGVFAAVSPGFRFEWTAMRPGWEEWGAVAYPGDDYVDVVGMDIYWRVGENDEQWDTEVWERTYLSVLADHRDFAEAHDKLIAYPEWGLSGADTPRFIEAMHDWLASLDRSGASRLLYHAYFNTDSEFSLDLYPLAAERYRELFGDT